ncbi:vitamin B12 ABC transporter ATP-binding protein BtuD [Gibbsiella quercinecans]|uniref:vitamin B12 ABC transporter ATP-binding protein BtuD n=1 Tax=Gibbsiella quercinecans TaxID=929813 RepID=UPI000EF2249D|nr:vitamin B12 ABC transporter ATP-binding protein BtuD [Gibbsiella quercinecans]RLM16798.1 vitamin B12 ABC transporter ATP-binding protein BtuD [Gibbsiella quercinecans]
MLELNQVSVDQRLFPLSARVAPGSQIHLIGPNGAGKSTLLARVAGLLPGGGQVLLDGQPLSHYSAGQLARRRAYLGQQQPPAAFMPVFQYLALHQPPGCGAAVLEDTLGYLCRQLKLADKLPRMLAQLSGGEWQRVRLVAALLQVWPAVNPLSRLLLLDEPGNSLDVAQKAALDRLLSELCQQGRSVLVCAHDLNQTLQQADQVWLLRAGRVVAQGPSHDVMVPALLSPVYEIGFHLQMVGEQRWLMTRDA